MNLLKKKVTKETLFSEYTKILNGVLELSPRELEVFSFLLLKDSENDPGLHTYKDRNINIKPIREQLMAKLKISEANLSRYLGTLKTKGLIVRGQTGWVINDLVRPIVNNKVFELKFVLEVE
jgi:hypothetical protein